MPTLLKQFLAAGAVAFAASALCAAPAAAAEHSKPTKAKSTKAKAKAEEHPKAVDVTGNPDADEPDIADTVTTEFNCELGNKVTNYQNANDDAHIALRWKKRLHRLTRVGTTTGAQRFENALFGLVWIGIPSKAMLLDSKQNRQLANECQNAAQSKAAASPAPAVSQ